MKQAVRYLDAAQLTCDRFGFGADDDLHASVYCDPTANGQSVEHGCVDAAAVVKVDGEATVADADRPHPRRLQGLCNGPGEIRACVTGGAKLLRQLVCDRPHNDLEGIAA